MNHMNFKTKNIINQTLLDCLKKGLPAYSRIALLDTRQLSRDELVKLLPEKWITNYEQIHQAPVRSTSAPKFVRHENGLVEIKFSSSQSKSDNVFPTWIHIITPTDQEPAQEVKHIWWDVCNCESCLDEAAKIDDDDDEDLLRKRKSSKQKLKRMYGKGDPTVGLLGEPSGKFDYYVLYTKAEPSRPLLQDVKAYTSKPRDLHFGENQGESSHVPISLCTHLEVSRKGSEMVT
uniref:Putative zinc finger, CCHC-type n=1 Tax=Tanacetum cinerariifolium TaxID=118510 RepID=A0A699HRN7_TANCI|nr:putative zinc finger, CCHC-type [Tanacetum cinerariifolium]